MFRSQRILIGVDFGTTFTGVAYSDPSNETAEPFLFTEWPQQNTDKVPTIIRYNVSDKLKGAVGFKWGHQVKDSERRHEWFKLGLDPMTLKASTSVDLSQKYPSKVEEAPHYEKKSRDLAIDYLTSVRKHVIKKLGHRYGSTALNNLKIEWIMTVPAVWTPEAKHATRDCAEAAGMGKGEDLLMTSEPEAAAVYALKKIEPHNRIKNLKPVLHVEESGICSGGKCGSVFLNRVFEDVFDQKLGSKVISEQSRGELREQWEHFTKRKFDDEEDEDYILPVPGLPDVTAPGLKIKGSRVRLSPSEAKKIFDVVIEPVVELVRGQITNITGNIGECKVSAIVLIGGFSECEYLAKRLRQEFETPSLVVIKSPNAWTAVTRGAVMKGLEGSKGTVKSRKSPCHYGTPHSSEFQAGKHRESYKYWDSFEGKFMCRNCITWFVNRGDDLEEAGPQRHEFYRIVSLNDELIFTDELYESFEDDTPEYSTDNCKLLGTLRSDLSNVPKWKFDKITAANGVQCYKVEYTLMATFYSAQIEFALDIKGTTYSSVRLDYANSKLPKNKR